MFCSLDEAIERAKNTKPPTPRTKDMTDEQLLDTAEKLVIKRDFEGWLPEHDYTTGDELFAEAIRTECLHRMAHY